MAVQVKPIVISSDDSLHQVAPDGSVIANAYIDKESLVSSDTGNLLTVGSDGQLSVPTESIPKTDPKDLVSAQSGNQLEVALDGKLYAKATDIPGPEFFISTDADNQLVSGSDNGLFVAKVTVPTPSDFISSQDGNQVKLGADDKLFVAAVEPSALVSDDASNGIKLGQDGKLYTEHTGAVDLVSTKEGNSLSVTSVDKKLYVRTVSADDGNIAVVGSDSGVRVTGTDIISNGITDNMLKVDSVDGRLEVSASDVEAKAKAAVTVVSADSANVLVKGSDGGAYLPVNAIPDQLKAGDGIAVEDGYVSVNYGSGLTIKNRQLTVDTDALTLFTVSTADQILDLSSSKVLSAEVSAAYDTNTGYLTLYGKNKSVLSSVYVPGAVSALQDVEVVTNPAGYTQGQYYRYTFILSVGGTKTIYVPVPSGTTVAAGAGIGVTTAGDVSTVSAKVKSNGGLLVDDSGLYIDTSVIATETGLTKLEAQVASNTSSIKTLQDEIDAIDASGFSISASTVDPALLDNGNGALYPATDLL